MNVNVGVINFNGERTLAKVIENLLGQRNVNLAIKIYDDCSTDKSIDSVQKYIPKIEVKRMEVNLGPNPLRNKAIKDSFYNFTLIMDNDIYFEKDGISKLVKILDSNANCMACSPLIAYNSDKNNIQYNGVRIHYIGGAIIKTGKISELTDRHYFKSTCLGAGALLVKNKIVEEIGFFDEDFFFGWEDGDFTFRITSAGYDCFAVPSIVAFHDDEKRDSSKIFYQVRNRWYFILKNYSLATILLIFPMFLLYEIFLACFLFFKKSSVTYLKANVSVIKSLPTLVKKRKVVKKMKSIGDSKLLHSGEIYTRNIKSDSKIIQFLLLFVNKLFDSYWLLVKTALR